MKLGQQPPPVFFSPISSIRNVNPQLRHHHFICEKCGTIIDIDISCPNLNKTLIQGHHIKKVEGYFKGICRKCKEHIRGHAYYILKRDCLYEGENISSCGTIVLCANCYHELDKWLKK
jgi:hypothetical protein